MTHSNRTRLSFLIAVLLGCGGSGGSGPDDAGGGDASATDAGVTTDAGGDDAGVERDAGAGDAGCTCSLPNATAECTPEGCAITTCDEGFDDCDGDASNGCEADLASTTSCGECGTLCDPANGIGVCTDRSCGIASCSTGYGDCDAEVSNGCETPLDTLTSCGACGATCDLGGASEACVDGSCAIVACDAGYGDCNVMSVDGCETTLDTVENCGACGAACALANASPSCTDGACTIAACDVGYDDCNVSPVDGCEVALDTVSNCGACGRTCSLANAVAACADGGCAIGSCASSYGDCNSIADDGCETSLLTNTNCGACGTACTRANATATCATGTCAISACAMGYEDCNGNDADGCEFATTVRSVTAWQAPTTTAAPNGFTNAANMFASDDVYATSAKGPGCNCPWISLSWNGGATWSATDVSSVHSNSTDTVRTTGGATDTWGRTWTPAELGAASFRLRVQNPGLSVSQGYGGFDLSAVPAGATIVGIEVALEARSDAGYSTMFYDQVRVRVHYARTRTCGG